MGLFALGSYAPSEAARQAAAQARDRIDSLMAADAVFRPGPAQEAFTAILALSEIHADAHLSAVDVPIDSLTSEMSAASPVAVRLRGIAAVHSRIAADARDFHHTPPRILGSWHLALTAGLGLADDVRGRPRVPGELVDDPLNIGTPEVDLAEFAPTLIPLATDTGDRMPPLIRAACIHLLIDVAMPFGFGNGVLARGAAAAALRQYGTDPRSCVAIRTAFAAAGRSAYVRSLREAAQLTPAAVDEWVLWYCAMVIAGVEHSHNLAERAQQAAVTPQ